MPSEREKETLRRNFNKLDEFGRLEASAILGDSTSVGTLIDFLCRDEDGSIARAIKERKGQRVLDALEEILKYQVRYAREMYIAYIENDAKKLDRDVPRETARGMAVFYSNEANLKGGVITYLRRLEPSKMSVQGFFEELSKVAEMLGDS